VKRTLKRELKEHENVMREPNLISKILIRTTYGHLRDVVFDFNNSQTNKYILKKSAIFRVPL
jgi:hypothetical protein